MQIWAEPEKAALPICNYSQILYQFLTFTQNLKRSRTVILLYGAEASITILQASWILSTSFLENIMLFCRRMIMG